MLFFSFFEPKGEKPNSQNPFVHMKSILWSHFSIVVDLRPCLGLRGLGQGAVAPG